MTEIVYHLDASRLLALLLPPHASWRKFVLTCTVGLRKGRAEKAVACLPDEGNKGKHEAVGGRDDHDEGKKSCRISC